MGKRKRKFEQYINSDIFYLLEYYLSELKEVLDDLEAYYITENINTYTWQHPDHGRIAIQKIKQLHNILKNRIFIDEINTDSPMKEHKGKGKLNLHETDKEIRDKLLKLKEEDWGE